MDGLDACMYIYEPNPRRTLHAGSSFIQYTCPYIILITSPTRLITITFWRSGCNDPSRKARWGPQYFVNDDKASQQTTAKLRQSRRKRGKSGELEEKVTVQDGPSSFIRVIQEQLSQ